MAEQWTINRFTLGERFRPYIIAEIGVNHEGSLEKAIQLIDAARTAGAHAAKFQTYKADKIAIKNSPAYWDTSLEPTTTQHGLFQQLDSFGQAEYEALASHCKASGIDFLSTPFDLDAADFLAPLMPAYKIASADITNVPLIRRCASYRKPLILSTGASTLDEIDFAIAEALEHGAAHIALLHCVLNYPTPASLAQLGFIDALKKRFPGFVVGYSDHVVPDEAMSSLVLATSMDCQIIEKHFTHDKTLPGNDHYHAMDQSDLSRFCRELERYRLLYGSGNKDLEHEKMAILHARRSIVAATGIKAGDRFTEGNLIAKRPGHGISPIHWDVLLTCIAATDIAQDEALQWEQVVRPGADAP
jgi:N-acetylneuraminate synthase